MNPPDKNMEDLGGTKILTDIPSYKKNIEREKQKVNRESEIAGSKEESDEKVKNDAHKRKSNPHKKRKSRPSEKAMDMQKKSDGRKKRVKKERSKPFTMFLTAMLMVAIMLGFAICGGLVGAYVGIINSIPDLGIVSIKPGTYTSIVYDSDGKELGKLHGGENREYVTLDQIPKNMQQAVIAIEDERFYDHNGVDIQGFARAMYSTLTGKQMQGGSTITQQLIKNNVTKVVHNNWKSKIKEQYLALKYEKELRKVYGSKEAAKNYILELYLNTIGLGHG